MSRKITDITVDFTPYYDDLDAAMSDLKERVEQFVAIVNDTPETNDGVAEADFSLSVQVYFEKE